MHERRVGADLMRAFDQFRHGYYATGEKAGQAWNAGSALAKAALGR